MQYLINPCIACHKKLKSNCNINELNNCFTETIAAYNGTPNNFSIINSNKAKDNWKECMLNKMKTLPKVAVKERNFNNFQLNTSPVFVSNHYFPEELVDKKGDKNSALKSCLIKCGDSLECKINCQTDYDALIDYKTDENIKEQNTNMENTIQNDTNNNSNNDTNNDNVYLIVLGVNLFIITLSILLIKFVALRK